MGKFQSKIDDLEVSPFQEPKTNVSYQLPFQEPINETTYNIYIYTYLFISFKAYLRPYTVQYLHFRIFKFPLIDGSNSYLGMSQNWVDQ